MLQDLSVKTVWILMTILITSVSIPGIAILFWLHSLFPGFPAIVTPLNCAFFICHAIVALAFSLFIILVYSDVVYPIVIYSFAQLLSRQALAKEPPPNMQYYLPHDETLNGTMEESQMERSKNE